MVIAPTTVARWSAAVADSFAPATLDGHGRAFRAVMDPVALDDVLVAQVRASAHVVEHTDAHLPAPAAGRLVACLHLPGERSVVVQDGRTAVLEPGDVSFYDTTRPYTLVHEGEVACLGVVVPLGRLTLAPAVLGAVTATRLPSADPLAGAAMRALLAQHAVAGVVSPAEARRLASSVVALVEALCLRSAERTDATAARGADDRWDRVVRHLEDHLSDPDLTPGSVAAAHFMSVRSLQELARAHGTTVSAQIRERRLERCRDDLADPALAHLGVARIGATWGLHQPSHFTTLFRERFGESPSTFRLRAHTQAHRAPTEEGAGSPV